MAVAEVVTYSISRIASSCVTLYSDNFIFARTIIMKFGKYIYRDRADSMFSCGAASDTDSARRRCSDDYWTDAGTTVFRGPRNFKPIEARSLLFFAEMSQTTECRFIRENFPFLGKGLKLMHLFSSLKGKKRKVQ